MKPMNNIIYTPFLNYLRIAAEAHKKMVQYINSTGKTWLNNDEFPQSADGQATIVIIYCVIALECYIFNYASQKFSKTFCNKHFESMSLLRKWLEIPKVVTGKGIPPDNKGIALLQNLIKSRRNIIHARVVNIQPDKWDKQKTEIIKKQKVTLEAALSAFRCVGELGGALSVIDPREQGAKILAEFLISAKYSVRWEPSA
jgi:hypothetical protein